ncbi:3-isopropylmalate/(R)-2-methylmalate dehydratase large subunit [Bosea sp. OK403]|uniref:3-isopropylmalate dehydratase large subunit n=1 Tax=Bosea sp. OK403 TaxID=1855286 RepID=UPI0008EE06BB|nr:3-isopropylmalate dehydratase large subunit [Bosea sp. OK403]SFI04475.1 3-isopropylmalate/(R)-2-methylmalate dehydratase large subunit [Bosea sp. OK403]
MAPSLTLFDKVWNDHVVTQRGDGQTLLYVDRLYVADDILPDVFPSVLDRGVPMRRPERSFGTPDHYIPTTKRRFDADDDAERRGMVETLERTAARTGMTLFGLDDPRQGIVHVMGPEQGLTLPGSTIVCADSHTSTHGAFGAFAFGIGFSELSHVVATQSLWQRRPGTMRIRIEGTLSPGVCAKDLILAIIGRIGVGGAAGHVIEYAGGAIARMSMEGRMTVCNMSIEAGARGGMIAPDETTIAYLADRPFAPKGVLFDKAAAAWRRLASDPQARFDREVALDASALSPMVTWGTTPEDAIGIDELVPDPDLIVDLVRREHARRALAYMGLSPGMRLSGLPVDCVFIGSCTNGRIEDLREAAAVIAGRKVVVPSFVVPGSGLVKRQAEAEGLDRIFKEAGFAWREAGCSMCIAINGDAVPAGQRCAATTNRNFVNRQGPGARTHLLSPAMAASAAVNGCLTDIRQQPAPRSFAWSA